MNFNKIDKTLFSIVSMLQDDKRWECIVHAYDYERTKNILLHKNIKILKEYSFIGTFRVLATKRQLLSLTNLSQVKFVSSVSKVSALMNVAKKILGVDNEP